MILKNIEIEEIMESLSYISEKEITNIPLAFKLSKLLIFFRKHAIDIYTHRNKIIDEYSLKDENGKPVKDKNGMIAVKEKDKFPEVTKKITELMNTELSLEIPCFITFEELGKAGLILSPAKITGLDKLIKQ